MKMLSYSNTDHFTKNEKQSLVLLGIVFLLGILSVAHVQARGFEGVVTLSPQEESILLHEMTDSHLDDVYDTLGLKGQAVFILNTETRERLYARNIDTVMPLASLTKVMTALVALEHIQENESITVPREALGLAGDNGLLVGEEWGRDDLIRFMLITSSNDAARALALHVGEGNTEGTDPLVYFTNLMNDATHRLTLSHTHFQNETGLDVDDARNGGYGTAREMADLFDYAIETYPNIFSSTTFTTEEFVSRSHKQHTAHNTNPYTGQVAGISASKTGFTNLSGGNLIVSFKNQKDETLIAVVLGSTFTERFTDIEKVAETTLRLMNEVQ